MRFLCLDKPVIIQNRWYNKVYSCVKFTIKNAEERYEKWSLSNAEADL